MSVSEPSDLRRLLDAVVAISSEFSLPVALRRIIATAVELVDARYGALGVLDESGTRLAEFIPVGIEPGVEDAIGHRPEGRGILGRLIVDPQPLRLPDLHTHPDSYGFPPHHPPMTSFLGVPIRVRGEVFGNLYLCDKAGGEPFTEVDQELIVALAGAAGVAIESARLHARVSEMSVLEDRERIARDLHDSVIQRLFATGLTLEGAAAHSHDPEVAERLERAVEDLDETVRHIRTTIFELQRQRLPGRSVRRELLDLAAETAEVLGSEPRLRFEGPIDALVDDRLADHLLAVARECLSNAVKHASTPYVDVEVAVVDGRVRLVVTDNGIGIDGSISATGFGLANLRSRATELGGSFTIAPRSSGGTEVRWEVPLKS